MDENFRDLIAIQQLHATQKLAQQVAQSNSKGKPCPYCGGDAIPNYERCKNCASPLSWVEDHPCKPGEEKRLTQSLAEARVLKEAQEKRLRKKTKWVAVFLLLIVGLPLVSFAIVKFVIVRGIQSDIAAKVEALKSSESEGAEGATPSAGKSKSKDD